MLGLALPDDYKVFIDRYGTGRVVGSGGGWMDIWNFRSAALFDWPLRDLLSGDQSEVARYRRHAADGYQCPYPMYPAGGGLLPFGRVRDVDNLNWLTEGDASRWDIVYWEFDDPKFTRCAGETLTPWVLRVLSGKHTDIAQVAGPYRFQDDDW